jgi:hypothetical protein
MVIGAENSVITQGVLDRKDAVVNRITRVDRTTGRINTISIVGRGEAPDVAIAEVICTRNTIVTVGVDDGKNTTQKQVARIGRTGDVVVTEVEIF